MKRCVGLAVLCALAGCNPGTETGLVSIALFHNADDAKGPGAGTAFGMVTEPAGDRIVNLAECRFNAYALATYNCWTCRWHPPGRGTLGCLESLPAVGTSAMADVDIRHGEYVETWDAEGAEITAGSIELVKDQFVLNWYDDPMNWFDAAPLHSGIFDTIPTGSAGLKLRGILVPYAGTSDFDWPDAIVATSPDPTEIVRVTTGDTIDFAWVPGTRGDLFLLAGVVRNRIREYPSYMSSITTELAPIFEVHGLDDSVGSYSYDVDGLGFEPPFDAGVVILRRWTDTSVDASGSTARISAVSDQWFYLEYEDVQGWTELDERTLIDSCADAASLVALPAGDYYGDLRGLANNAHPAPDDLFIDYDNPPFRADGRDGIVRVDLVEGETLTARLRQPHHDSMLDRLDSSCMMVSYYTTNSTRTGGTEELSYTAVGDETVYLVVDSRDEDSGGRFALTIEIE